MSGKIFINYRRSDDAGSVGRLYDRLRDSFAADQIFMDVDNIPLGVDFMQEVEKQIGKCDLFLAVIGPRWLYAEDKKGNRRLNKTNDPVRIEIDTGLRLGKPIIPVLASDADMPSVDDLPELLKPLANQNGVRLTHERFDSDVQHLIKAIEQVFKEGEGERRKQEEAADRGSGGGMDVVRNFFTATFDGSPETPWAEWRKQVDAADWAAQALSPNDAVTYTKRGDAYSSKGEHARAIVDYTKAIALNPNYAVAYTKRGIACGKKGEHARAIVDYTKAIALSPNDAVAYTNRGSAYAKKGEHARAIVDYTKAIALNPNYAVAYANRGSAYDDKGEVDRAIADYTKAIALDPKLAQAYYNRGYAYQNKGEVDRAIADYDKAIALDPNDALAYYSRGYAYQNKGEVERAIADYTKAIALNPNYANAYTNRGVAYRKKGDTDRAIADYHKALEINPSDQHAKNNLKRLGVTP